MPARQRNFATKKNLPAYPEKIAALKAKGARQVMVYGIGRVCHIAFWEPQFADEFKTYAQWKKVPYRIGANLHPFTIEQNAITSFRSSWPLIPCYANTIARVSSSAPTTPSAARTACCPAVCNGRVFPCG